MSQALSEQCGKKPALCCGWSHSKCSSVVEVIPTGGGDQTSISSSNQVCIPWKHIFICIVYSTHHTHYAQYMHRLHTCTRALFNCLCPACITWSKGHSPPPDHPLLFPCERSGKVTLPVKLKSLGFPLQEVICFETVHHLTLWSEVSIGNGVMECYGI